MVFNRYICWNPNMIRRVMDVEATHPEDHLFLATHHPAKMYRQSLSETQSRISYDEESFLADFLGTPDFAFVPVLGTSGTGKSHLIRWLYTRIKSIKNPVQCRVLLIPKVGTNLRDIIEKILEGLDGSEFDSYRSRLKQATSSLTEGEVREQLLANLAIAVGLSGKQNVAALTEIEYEIARGLPDLLRDPFFIEEFWLKSGGIIDRLVVHILGNQGTVEDVEERRGFSIEDLPEGARHISKASEKAREFYTTLTNDFIPREKVVEWLNKHLDEAIAKVLNLGQEDLQRLMLDVRRALAKRNIELILLIEDFAKLQGIDREVLEAVLARPQQGAGEPRLCAMRTALACTTGYFQGLIDTVRTRVEFSVNLDVETVGEQSLVTQLDVQQLAARYLNAVRLQDQEIRDWMQDADEKTRQPHNPVPIACESCEYQTECHAGFGEVDSIGLYPFNAIAIERMRDRVNRGVFNPRILIKEVLRHVLEYHRSDIEKGQFPSRLLLDQFSGYVLDPMILNEIKSRDTLEDADRRETLLKLWTDSKQLCDLPTPVHTAFDLPPLGVQVQRNSSPTAATVVRERTASFSSTFFVPLSPSDQQSEDIPISLAERLQAIDQWSNGEQLDSKAPADDLRSLIFAAIDARIDWNSELLLRNHFMDRIFKSRNINFKRSATYSRIKDVELLLPLKEDFGDTAIALKAILLYKHYQHWKFPNGASYFRIYAKCLEEWSHFVLQEFTRCTTRSGSPGDPIPATVELLAIAGRMAGRRTDSIEDRVNAVFTDLEKVEVDSRASSWQKLFNALKKNQPKLEEILKARLACTKGNASQLQMVDAAQLVAPLSAVAKDWQPKTDVSDISSDPPFNAILNARTNVDLLLEQAIREERDRQLEIYQTVLDELGDDFSQKEVVEALTQAISKVKSAGISGSTSADLEAAIQDFKNARLAGYLSSMRSIQGEQDNGRLLQQLSTLSQRPIGVLSNFLKHSRNAINRMNESAQKNIDDLKTSGGNELETSYTGIEKSLVELQDLAKEIGEEPCL
ncbi:protein DpdH [Leptolyngbya sp. GGD]|uniref:protein DpdH n=1 Tax=Leptolyngbya sp. GGD TaxID=2997907 RepID=UPI00227CB14F|nr:protein DpdH [Leptolyngbya sp. GGD]MCY6493403.1 protein DpdH [Leptolyngbya sp. GGD]